MQNNKDIVRWRMLWEVLYSYIYTHLHMQTHTHTHPYTHIPRHYPWSTGVIVLQYKFQGIRFDSLSRLCLQDVSCVSSPDDLRRLQTLNQNVSDKQNRLFIFQKANPMYFLHLISNAYLQTRSLARNKLTYLYSNYHLTWPNLTLSFFWQ